MNSILFQLPSIQVQHHARQKDRQPIQPQWHLPRSELNRPLEEQAQQMKSSNKGKDTYVHP